MFIDCSTKAKHRYHKPHTDRAESGHSRGNLHSLVCNFAVACSLLWYLLHIPSQFFYLQKEDQKEETTPFGVRIKGSLVIYQAVVHLQSCMQVLVIECRQLRRELGQDSALGLQSLEAPRFSKRARQMEPEMELAADAAVHLSEMHAGHLRSVRAPLQYLCDVKACLQLVMPVIPCNVKACL